MKFSLAFICALAAASPIMAALTVTLTPGIPSPEPVGTTISFTGAVIGDPDSTPVYEYTFGAELQGAPNQVRKGFSKSPNWSWTPTAFEGNFNVQVTIKNVHSGDSGSTTIPYVLTSRLVSGHAAVNVTNHPLVAFFSAPACQMPNLMRVVFTPTSSVPTGGISTANASNLIPCRAASTGTTDLTSMNFEVAGMYPSTTYNLHYEVDGPTGAFVRAGTDYPFTTGAIPGTVHFPAFSATGTSGDPQEPLVVYSVVTIPVNGTVYTSAATDLAGNVIWYATTPPVRTEIGGNYFGFVNGTDPYTAGLAELDLAGNTVLQTSVGAISEQLVAKGLRPITSFHHEVRRIFQPTGQLPNGYILTIGNVEKVTTTAQGGTTGTPVDVLGDMIIVLDTNLNVAWTWDAFNFLDIRHTAVLNEKCTQPGGAGCEPFNTAFSTSNDWLHTNSVQYTSYDGNLIFSERHQDNVFKVAFGDLNGDGHVIWQLGNPSLPAGAAPYGGLIKDFNGNPFPQFSLTTTATKGNYQITYPWFSHQHDAEVELQGQLFPAGTRVLTIFDDGNVRVDPTIGAFPGGGDSRCQLYAIDETNHTANLNRNGDMGSFSFAVGSAQLLKSGGISCDSGFIGGFPAATTNPKTQSVEIGADSNASVLYTQTAAQDTYRTFRMQDLFTPDTP